MCMILLSFTSFAFMCLDSSVFFWTGYALAFLAFVWQSRWDLARLYGIDNKKGCFRFHCIIALAIPLSKYCYSLFLESQLRNYNLINRIYYTIIRRNASVTVPVYAHKFIIKRENISSNHKNFVIIWYLIAKSFGVQLFILLLHHSNYH